MKNSRDGGFDQHYNAQLAVDQQALLIVSYHVSAHAHDQLDALPTIDALVSHLGKPKRVALDSGYLSDANIAGFEARQIDPYIAVGRQTHHQFLPQLMAPPVAPPAPDANPKENMAYKLQTPSGKSFYRLRKCTVEPVIGIIKETMGFRQFSLRGLSKVTGEWGLVCLAFNLKRLHRLEAQESSSPTGC